MKHVVTVMGISLAFGGTTVANDGKQVFLDNHCNRCHAIASHDIEATVKSKSMLGPDLGDIGDNRDSEWLVKYLEREIEVEGKKHRIPYGGTDDDLKTIAEWLAELKS